MNPNKFYGALLAASFFALSSFAAASFDDDMRSLTAETSGVSAFSLPVKTSRKDEGQFLMLSAALNVAMNGQSELEKARSMRYRRAAAERSIGRPHAFKELEDWAKNYPAVEKSTEAAESSAPYFRLAAYANSKNFGDLAGRDLARKVLEDPVDAKERAQRDARRAAIWILGETGNPDDIALLNQTVGSPSQDGKEVAYETFYESFLAKQALKTIAFQQRPPSERLSYLFDSLDSSPDSVTFEWAKSELWRNRDPLTDRRIRIYLTEWGHSGIGYRAAAYGLSER